MVHGEYDEKIALLKYTSLRRLITGVIDNVISNQDFATEMENLGWNREKGEPA